MNWLRTFFSAFSTPSFHFRKLWAAFCPISWKRVSPTLFCFRRANSSTNTGLWRLRSLSPSLLTILPRNARRNSKKPCMVLRIKTHNVCVWRFCRVFIPATVSNTVTNFLHSHHPVKVTTALIGWSLVSWLPHWHPSMQMTSRMLRSF